MLTWFRMYSEFATDPKVQSMEEALQRRFLMFLCLQCSGEYERLDDEELAFALRISPAELVTTKDVFKRKGFLDDNGKIRNWNKRQFVSDSSRERVSKYREKRRAMGLSGNGYTVHSETVNKRDGCRCVYCGGNENLCIDHVLPINQSGTDDIDNLACACKRCNSGKAGRTPEQAGYSWWNREAEARWKAWMSRRVTVTEAPPSRPQTQITDTDSEKNPSASSTPARTKVSRVAVQPDWLLDFKIAYPERAGDQGWRKAERAANARFAEGHTAAEFIEGAKRYAAFCQSTGKVGTEFVQQAATFLGPGKPFLLPWHAPPKVEQLSPVERVLRANGVSRDERVVAEQFGSGNNGLGDPDGNVRQPTYAGLRRIGS